MVAGTLLLPLFLGSTAASAPQGCPTSQQLQAACPPAPGGSSAIAGCMGCSNAHHFSTASCSQQELFALCRSQVGGKRRPHFTVPAPPSGALSARDFGAKGDGRTDDQPALQAAIHAAQRQGRALYLPAGDYLIGATLVVECSVPNCCEACNTSETNCAVSACGPLQFNPLRMMGEAQFTTRVIAGPSFSGGALLSLPGSSINPPAGTLGNTTETHEISHMHLHANANGAHAGADYALFAPYITRSRFIALYITDARKAGIYLGYGWINDVLHCMFGGNGIGLQLVEAGNRSAPLAHLSSIPLQAFCCPSAMLPLIYACWPYLC